MLGTCLKKSIRQTLNQLVIFDEYTHREEMAIFSNKIKIKILKVR